MIHLIGIVFGFIWEECIMADSIVKNFQEAGRKFDEVIERSCDETLTYQGSVEQWEQDKQELKSILLSYHNKDFNTVSAVFAVLINVLIKHDIHHQIKPFKNLSLDFFLEVAENEIEKLTLRRIAYEIFDCLFDFKNQKNNFEIDITHLNEADNNNFIVKLYSFVKGMNDLVSRIKRYSNPDITNTSVFKSYITDKSINRKTYKFGAMEIPESDYFFLSVMVHSFQDMPEELQNYAIQKDFTVSDKHLFISKNYLPYIIENSSVESVMDSFFKMVPFKENIKNVDFQEFMTSEFLDNETKIKKFMSAMNLNNLQVAGRMEKLHIPKFIPSATEILTIAKMTVELIHQKDELVKTQKAKEAMIRKFSHEFGNMEVDNLYCVAKELLANENEDIRDHGRELMYEYHKKQDMTASIYLMRLEFTDDIDRLKILISRGICQYDEGNLYSLINTAWERSFIRVLYTNTPLEDRLDSYSAEFENLVLLGDMSMTSWLSQHFPLKISICDEWKHLYFISKYKDDNSEKILGRKPKAADGYSKVFFTNLFCELFYNMLKYADWKKSLSIDFAYDNTEHTYNVIISNVKNNEIESESREGISSFDRTLTVINNSFGRNWVTSVEVVDDNNNYKLTVILADQLMNGVMK